MANNTVLLHHFQEFLDPFFKTKGATDLCINKPGEVWIDTQDGWISINDKNTNTTLKTHTLKTYCSLLAEAQGTLFNDAVPVLATNIPKYGFRLHAINDNVALNGVSISIRIAENKKFSLENFFPNEFNDYKKTYNCENEELDKINMDNIRPIPYLIDAIKARKSILVVGGTSSGKTTFLNTLIRFIPEKDRIITVEDAPELYIEQQNKVRLLKNKTGHALGSQTYQDIIDSVVRMRPDRILFGELTTDNCFPFLNIANTGHAGSMTTFHANSPELAIKRLIMNCELGGSKASGEVIKQLIYDVIDYIVFIERISRRDIRAKVVSVKGMMNKNE